MVFHPLLEKFRGCEFSLIVEEHPASRLGMPYEAVACHCKTGCFTVLHELVCKLEVVFIFFRVQFRVLHAVLRDDGIEVQGYDRVRLRILVTDLLLVESRSDKELVPEDVLKS